MHKKGYKKFSTYYKVVTFFVHFDGDFSQGSGIVQSAENSYNVVTFVTFKKLHLLQFCNFFLCFAQK